VTGGTHSSLSPEVAESEAAVVGVGMEAVIPLCHPSHHSIIVEMMVNLHLHLCLGHTQSLPVMYFL
jgi:hypothetical protein